MADQKTLDWPFFEARHREMAAMLGRWAAGNISRGHDGDVRTACRRLVRRLGDAGWLKYAVAGRAFGGVDGCGDEDEENDQLLHIR